MYYTWLYYTWLYYIRLYYTRLHYTSIIPIVSVKPCTSYLAIKRKLTVLRRRTFNKSISFYKVFSISLTIGKEGLDYIGITGAYLAYYYSYYLLFYYYLRFTALVARFTALQGDRDRFTAFNSLTIKKINIIALLAIRVTKTT